MNSRRRRMAVDRKRAVGSVPHYLRMVNLLEILDAIQHALGDLLLVKPMRGSHHHSLEVKALHCRLPHRSANRGQECAAGPRGRHQRRPAKELPIRAQAD